MKPRGRVVSFRLRLTAGEREALRIAATLWLQMDIEGHGEGDPVDIAECKKIKADLKSAKKKLKVRR